MKLCVRNKILYWLPWVTIFCHSWGDSAMIRITSLVTKIVIHGNSCIVLYILHPLRCSPAMITGATTSDMSLAYCNGIVTANNSILHLPKRGLGSVSIERPSLQVWDFQYKHKTVVRPSPLYGNSYTDKMASLHWDGPPLVLPGYISCGIKIDISIVSCNGCKTGINLDVVSI